MLILIIQSVPTIGSFKDSLKNYVLANNTIGDCAPLDWTQQAKLLASDGVEGDYFGVFVSLSGGTALIGACYDDNICGSVYVFTRINTTRTQQTKLFASDGIEGDYFGYPVALDGDTALIGSPGDDVGKGSAYVFTRNGTVWMQQAKLLASDGAAGDKFGWSASIKGDNALVGAYYHELGRGSAYMFTRNGAICPQQAKLLTSYGVAGDYFGNTVSIDGNTVIIGAGQDDDNGVNSGSVYVFTKENENQPPVAPTITGLAKGKILNIISRLSTLTVMRYPTLLIGVMEQTVAGSVLIHQEI